MVLTHEIKGGIIIQQRKFMEALFRGSIEEVGRLTRGSLDQGGTPEKILNDGLVKAMDKKMERFIFPKHLLPRVRCMQVLKS